MISYKKAIKSMKHCAADYGGECNSCELAIESSCEDLIQEAMIAHYEKYKLHDLHRKPDDLPTKEGEIIVYLDGKIGRTEYKKAVMSVYWIPGKGFFDEAKFNDIVVGWREIPPMDE